MMTVTIDGDARVIRRLDAAIQAVGNAERPLKDIGDRILSEVQGNFAAEGSRLEQRKWQPLTAATIKDRLRRGFMAGPILQRTGSLRRSFQSDANKDRVRVFSDSEIMPYHQLGQGSNPRRRMLAFSERLKQEVVGIFVKFVHEALDANPRTKR